MIMRARAHLAGDDGVLWLDENHRYQLFLDANGELLDVRLDGVSHRICRVEDETRLDETERGLPIAPPSLSLQSIIQLRQATGHPVLLAENGRILGVCGEAQIIRALARGGRADPHDAASG
jgi:glycine betaine/proline transport system ATP-binding protein